MKDENAVVEKSRDFALRIVRLYKYLCEEKQEYVSCRKSDGRWQMSDGRRYVLLTQRVINERNDNKPVPYEVISLFFVA